MRRSLHLLAAVTLAVSWAAPFTGGQALVHQPAGHTPSVLLVCNGSTRACPSTRAKLYVTVQSAVNAAKPGDWILIWPGVYHENTPQWKAGVWVGTRDLHIRGLNRNGVIIDGSKGTARRPCPSSPSLQNFKPRNGIEVVASGVSVENLTVCDYLGDNGAAGNEIWWNGGDGTGRIGMASYKGSYLTATATYHPAFHKGTSPVSPHFAQYGIFVSNASGPGEISHSYASNMADAAYYVGACQRLCHTSLFMDVGTNSSLGYSGTNAGGHLVIRRSTFVGNRAGIVPNSLNNDDAPPPQDGRCPHSGRSCMLIENNFIVNNNNPDVPLSGLQPAIGAGIEISGGAYDTVRNNLISHQGSWGVLIHDYPDTERPPPASHCQGGFPNVNFLGGKACDFPARGNLVYHNDFSRVGFFGNPTNSDLATVGLLKKSPTPRNCFYGNVARGRRTVTSSPAHIERASVDGRPCQRRGTYANLPLLVQLLCAALGECATGMKYPMQTKLVVLPLPKLVTMARPCDGVPASAFCRR
jgi:hypothetical protein